MVMMTTATTITTTDMIASSAVDREWLGSFVFELTKSENDVKCVVFPVIYPLLWTKWLSSQSHSLLVDKNPKHKLCKGGVLFTGKEMETGVLNCVIEIIFEPEYS